MRESCSSGSVGGEGGNRLAYPADKLPKPVAFAETFRCRRQTDRARL